MQSTPLEEDKLPIRIDEQVLVSDSFGFRLRGFSFRFTCFSLRFSFGSRFRVFGFRFKGFSFRFTGFSFRLFSFRLTGFSFRLTGFSFRLTGFSFRLTGFSFRLMAWPSKKCMHCACHGKCVFADHLHMSHACHLLSKCRKKLMFGSLLTRSTISCFCHQNDIRASKSGPNP